MSQVISTKTPFGTLFARVVGGEEYPGIEIYALDKDGAEVSLSLVEAIPGGEFCDADTHVYGNLIDQSRIEYHNIDLYSGGQHIQPVLSAGLMARIWNDYNREDPVSITYHGLPECVVVDEELPISFYSNLNRVKFFIDTIYESTTLFGEKKHTKRSLFFLDDTVFIPMWDEDKDFAEKLFFRLNLTFTRDFGFNFCLIHPSFEKKCDSKFFCTLYQTKTSLFPFQWNGYVFFVNAKDPKTIASKEDFIRF